MHAPRAGGREGIHGGGGGPSGGTAAPGNAAGEGPEGWGIRALPHPRQTWKRGGPLPTVNALEPNTTPLLH